MFEPLACVSRDLVYNMYSRVSPVCVAEARVLTALRDVDTSKPSILDVFNVCLGTLACRVLLLALKPTRLGSLPVFPSETVAFAFGCTYFFLLLLNLHERYVRMLEALLATIIRPCLGQGSNKTPPLLKDDANELFGTLRAEEILAINTAFREQLRVSICTHGTDDGLSFYHL